MKKENLEKIRGVLTTYSYLKLKIQNFWLKISTERTEKTAFLHKVLSRFQRLSVATVYVKKIVRNDSKHQVCLYFCDK